MINKLLLKTGADIPFEECQLFIHQPTIKQLSFIGEEEFFNIVDLINFSKEKLKKQDRKGLESFSDFNIFMTMIQKEVEPMQKAKESLESLLFLLFPNVLDIILMPASIVLTFGEENEFKIIDENNFESFKEIINTMFYMSKIFGQKVEYNPANETAAKIAEKLRRGRERVAAQKRADGQEFDVFGKYASILSIGLKIDLNTIFNYTVYQLFYIFDRFEKKEAYDAYFQAQIAGASGMKSVKHWML